MAVSRSTGKPASDTTQPIKQIIRGKRSSDHNRRDEVHRGLQTEDDPHPQVREVQPPRLGLNFTEVVGKVIAFVNVINDPPNWQALEIRFTDGTLLHFELGSAPPQIKPTYMEARHGNLELIRSYGTLVTDEERTACERARRGDDRPYSF